MLMKKRSGDRPWRRPKPPPTPVRRPRGRSSSLGRKIRGKPSPIRELPEEGPAVIEGEVFQTEVRSKVGREDPPLFSHRLHRLAHGKVFSRGDREKLPEIRGRLIPAGEGEDRV